MNDSTLTPGEFRMLLIETLPTELIKFLENQYIIDRQKNPGRELDFLYYILDNIDLDSENHGGQEVLINSRIELVKSWVSGKLNELNNTGNPLQAGEKIKWKGTPSQFGYLFSELVKHGFIEPPLYNGETNYTGLAKLCYEYFDIESEPGKKTTPGNLTKELKPDNDKTGERKNTLSDTKRAKFNIPYLSDLA